MLVKQSSSFSRKHRSVRNDEYSSSRSSNSISVAATAAENLYSAFHKSSNELCVSVHQQEVKVIWQKAPHGGPIPRLGVIPGGRKLYHWIPGVGFPISVP